MQASQSFNTLPVEDQPPPLDAPLKTLHSSSEGGEREEPMMRSLPAPIDYKSLRTTSMPHPSTSCDGSGGAWYPSAAPHAPLTHIDEQPSLGSSPRHAADSTTSNRLDQDPGRGDEGGGMNSSSSPTVTHGHRPNTWQAPPGHPSTQPCLTFMSYLEEEGTPYEKEPQKDILWGQTERDRVYQYLLLVPFQLERLLQLGFVICVDTLLGTVTLLPLRCLFSLGGLLSSPRSRPWGGRGASGGAPAASRLTGGGRIFDILSLVILIAVTLSLKAIRPGFIYYWLKDITNEFLKMSVLSLAFDIFDRIFSNFGVNVLEALSGTCTLFATNRIGLAPLICDAFVAYLISLAHAFCLMCQALVVAVALNSRNGLMALLIASNLAETKSTVFKRFDVQRIRGLAFADCVERFNLVCILSFVVIEDMSSSGSWTPSLLILKESLKILLSEVAIDILKHAVLGKFNEVRPGLHREIFKELCDTLSFSPSHTYWRTISFHYLPAVGLVLRSVITLFYLKIDEVPGSRAHAVCSRLIWLAFVWLASVLLKLGLGFGLKIFAASYVEAYNSGPYGRAPVHRSIPTVNVRTPSQSKDPGHSSHTMGGVSSGEYGDNKKKVE